MTRVKETSWNLSKIILLGLLGLHLTPRTVISKSLAWLSKVKAAHGGCGLEAVGVASVKTAKGTSEERDVFLPFKTPDGSAAITGPT